MKYLTLIGLICIALFAADCLSAQELDGNYYPFGEVREQLPEIDVDSTLFYIPATDDGALFDRLMRYGLSSVRFERRGESGVAIDLDGVRVSANESYALQRLLHNDIYTDGMGFSAY